MKLQEDSKHKAEATYKKLKNESNALKQPQEPKQTRHCKGKTLIDYELRE